MSARLAGHRRCAVIGAGIAGMAAARTLADAGGDVTVFEKSRGPGGRMSTRRVETGRFDHGAQYFTARDGPFRAEVERWLASGLVSCWPKRVVRLNADGEREMLLSRYPRYIAVPGMSGLAGALGEGVDLRERTRIGRIKLRRDAVALFDDADRHVADVDRLVITAPLPQAISLLATADLALPAALARRRMEPCWAVLVTLPHTDLEFDAVRLRDDEALDWCAHDSSRPGRDTREDVTHLVLHATADWSSRWLESNPAEVAERLTRHCAGRLPELPSPRRAVAHRWRYARVADDRSSVDGAVALAKGRVWLAGDWVIGRSRVEDAWRSGREAALSLISSAADAAAR